jgi:hypothetical protein
MMSLMPRSKETRHDHEQVLAALDGAQLDGIARHVLDDVFRRGRSTRWTASRLRVRRAAVKRAVEELRRRARIGGQS